jgi:hypothetical protein
MLKTSSITSVKLRPNESKKAIAFGVVLQAARGPVPSLAEAIAGETIRGSWWGHAKGREIFRVSHAICESPEILVCKLIDNKVTYVHRRVWPALVKLAPRFGNERLATVWEEHTKIGAHLSRRVPFPEWAPTDVMKEAERLSTPEAERILSAVLPENLGKTARNQTRRPSPQSSPCQEEAKAQPPGQRRITAAN